MHERSQPRHRTTAIDMTDEGIGMNESRRDGRAAHDITVDENAGRSGDGDTDCGS